MEKQKVKIRGLEIDVYSLNTIIVGSGAAGFNAADSLYSMGQKDIAILTEGIKMGTSRNTGSDKQTYYKLGLEGDTRDSIMDMARTLFGGGAMHGDIALIEAANSVRCFYKLVEIGVPFPSNQYGEYVGYKTDHDPSKRATSAGPLTSKFMTECLEQQVTEKGITIFNRYRVIGLLTEKSKEEIKAIGLIAINLDDTNCKNMGLTLFNCTNIIYAVGGPGGMYQASVYPKSQMGASGIAFEAGAKGINLTESQYGLASIGFRWNVSGSYQQVIPRYVSIDEIGKEREFLNEYFGGPGVMMDAIFLKGYQWPFDPSKVLNNQSSIIDLLVYYETQVKGRKVYLDYTKNPLYGSVNGEMDFSLLGKESYTYLKKCDVLFGTPIERLRHMNEPAIQLYKDNGIDITKEYLEVAVCAQHNNGGLVGNQWWESNIKHLFPVGEVNGTFGVYRPGGTALNSTQVGSYRAATFISYNYGQVPMPVKTFLDQVKEPFIQIIDDVQTLKDTVTNRRCNVYEARQAIQVNMTQNGSFIRSLEACDTGIQYATNQLRNLFNESKISSIEQYPEVFINKDILLSQIVYLSTIRAYIKKGMASRGSYLIKDNKGELPHQKLGENYRFSLESEPGDILPISELKYKDNEWVCDIKWEEVRPIPKEENWFENTWKAYRSKEVFKER